MADPPGSGLWETKVAGWGLRAAHMPKLIETRTSIRTAGRRHAHYLSVLKRVAYLRPANRGKSVGSWVGQEQAVECHSLCSHFDAWCFSSLKLCELPHNSQNGGDCAFLAHRCMQCMFIGWVNRCFYIYQRQTLPLLLQYLFTPLTQGTMWHNKASHCVWTCPLRALFAWVALFRFTEWKISSKVWEFSE